MLGLILLTQLVASPAGLAPPGPGIPETLAQERARTIQGLRYELELRIPEQRTEPIRGREIVRFTLAAPHRVVLDFAQPRDRILSLTRGGTPVDFQFANNHLTIPASFTSSGANELTIEFLAGDDSLNRNDEFLYTVFVPARAHRAFPCFDQPDLKARYTLALEVPAGWKAVANGEGRAPGDTTTRYRTTFAETQPLSTYIFAFAAGKFETETATRGGRAFTMYHRETDAAKVGRNRDAIFDLHARALVWLEEYTGIPYPFGKFDFVLVPSFQFGGMEHAGAILYNASGLLLDESATQNQYLGRASVIAHETAHMWFGDLVTMKWFNDVWMKEVFANFMAAKIVNPSFPEVNHELRFLLTHYPSAYDVDRTAGANPIRQPLANLNDAGSLYGAIIYQKAPIVMRQLEMIVGETTFRDGLRDYLKRYAFANATWLDLIRILDERTPENLAAWSRAWVEERGRPAISVTRAEGRKPGMPRLTVTQRDPLGRGLLWPQRLTVKVGVGEGGEFPVYLRGGSAVITDEQSLPDVALVLPNGRGLAYGFIELDDFSRRSLLRYLPDLPDPLTRGAGWVTVWENLLEGRLTAAQVLDVGVRALPAEPDEQNAQRILGYMTRAFWRFLSQEERTERAPALEALLREGVQRASSTSLKSALFTTFRDIALTKEGLAWLERVWRREDKIPGLTFAETDEINMAMELAVREAPAWEKILVTQHERIQNPDRKARFAFVMPALSADPLVREQSFERLRDPEHRRREPWVLEALQYLHHPLRETHARRFIRPSLELLREIHRTGDIFFPKRWMDATLGGHRSEDAVATVRDFLAANPMYPQRLRWTILSAADELFRATSLQTTR